MAIAEPVSMTLLGAARTLNRTGTGMNEGAFAEDDRESVLVVKHTYNGKRARRVARVDLSRIAADPLAPSINATSSMSAYLVVDVPLVGFTVAEQVGVVTGLTGWLTASTNAALTKIIGGES